MGTAMNVTSIPSAAARERLRLSSAGDLADTVLMDACLSCGARLLGEPEWCPRCLTRRDRVPAPAPAMAAAAGAAPTATASWQGNGRQTPVSLPRTEEAASATATVPAAMAPSGKNPITPTVVKAILLGVGLQIVMAVLAIGMR